MDPTTFRLFSGAAAEAPPVQITFYANSYYTYGGGTLYMYWDVLHAASVSINQGIGAVAASGNQGVGGTNVSRTYTLTAIGLNGITYTSSITLSWGEDCIWARYGMPERC